MSENQAYPGGDGRDEQNETTAQQPGSEWAGPRSAPVTPPPSYGGYVSGSAPVTPGMPMPSTPHGTPQAPPPATGFDPSLGWRPGSTYPGQNWSQTGATTTTPEPHRSHAFRNALVAIVGAGAIALAAGGVGGFVGYALHSNNGSALQIPATSGNNNGGAAPVIDRSSLASIAAALQPAIVDVKTNSGEGSGVVVSADGEIVTNNHVVSGARGTVKVTFNSGKQVDATIVGTDPKTDLAVLKVNATGLTFAKWGDSDAVRVGDTVLAIGSPLGLQGSVTAGIVSALHRTITEGPEQRSQFDTGSTTTIGDAIQTDAPINPGNSGGALVNMSGEVIGINSAIATAGSNGSVGVGFAISANKAKAVTSQLASGGKVSHPFLGVSISDASSGGAQIQTVEPGGPADKAGIKAGDVVTKVGDRPITGSEDLIGAIQGSTVGGSLQLTIVRGGSTQTITVTVGEQ
jgi:putative serine protease PepD